MRSTETPCTSISKNLQIWLFILSFHPIRFFIHTFIWWFISHQRVGVLMSRHVVITTVISTCSLAYSSTERNDAKPNISQRALQASTHPYRKWLRSVDLVFIPTIQNTIEIFDPCTLTFTKYWSGWDTHLSSRHHNKSVGY